MWIIENPTRLTGEYVNIHQPVRIRNLYTGLFLSVKMKKDSEKMDYDVIMEDRATNDGLFEFTKVNTESDSSTDKKTLITRDSLLQIQHIDTGMCLSACLTEHTVKNKKKDKELLEYVPHYTKIAR